MSKTINPIIQDFRRRPLDWLLRIVTLVILSLATYITIRLQPLYEGIKSLDFRVQAIEKRNENVDPLVTRFIQLEERDEALIKDVEEIEKDIQKLLDLHTQR